jgi:transglutaminase-like putative cysteine protease
MMLLAFAAACALHVDRAPLWCSATAAAAVLWHGLYQSGRLALPSRWTRYGLAAVLLGGVLLNFGTVNGLAAGSALLMVMVGMKLLETRNRRDAVVVTTTALILLLAAGLDRQDLSRLPLYLATGWLALATLAALGNHAASTSTRRAFAAAGKAALLAIPFAVLAFVLVPRLPGALWSLPGSERAQTGLSDEMSPGSISELVISDAIAFRVRFEGEAPPPDKRYWRGPVLHEFDGLTWRTTQSFGAVPQQVQFLSPPVHYQVMLEPHGQPYLFALDMVASVDGRRHTRTFDGQLLAHRPVTSPLIYEGSSHLEWRHPGELSALARRLDTRLPPGRNPRTLALAAALRAEVADDRAYAEHVMRYFAEGGFEYTLTPPLLDYDSVDELLFNTRLGFCGHFASAFVTLMRAAGVPARVVTGYLGGSWNPIGRYYVVRQSDAHAWAEVWIDGEGWVRFDPTSVVAPQRLTRGLAEFLPAARSAAAALVEETGWLRALRDGWDAAGSWWRERIVHFNAARQRDLLGWLGLTDLDYAGMAALLLAAAVAWAGVLLLLAGRTPRARPDAIGRLWGKFAAVLAHHGLAIAEHEGPEAVRRRATQAWPAAGSAIERFTRGYEMLRFGRGPASGHELASLRVALREVRQALSRTARRKRPG